MKIQLLKTIREVVNADSDPVRQALFEHVRTHNLIVSLVWQTHRIFRKTFLSTAMIFVFGAKSYAATDVLAEEKHLPLIVAIHKNAVRQGNKFAAWLAPQRVLWLQTGAAGIFKPRALFRLAKGVARVSVWKRFLPLLNRLNRRYDFLVSCRAASALFCYVRALETLDHYKPNGVFVSSDSNPEPLAFARAASVFAVPTVFMSHAYPTPVSPRLQFTLSILEGEAALESYQAMGPVEGEVLFCGAEGESQPMNARRLLSEEPVIGIFMPKVVCWPQLVSLIEDCRKQFRPKRILIRWHPNMLGRSRLPLELSDMSGVIETDPTMPLDELSRQCDWVITDENSNVNLGVLKAGVPLIPMKDFSVLPASRADLYGFVKNAVIPSPVITVNEVSLEQLAQFYSQDWRQRFGRYDASYSTSSQQLAENARNAIERLLSSGLQSKGQEGTCS